MSRDFPLDLQLGAVSGASRRQRREFVCLHFPWLSSIMGQDKKVLPVLHNCCSPHNCYNPTRSDNPIIYKPIVTLGALNNRPSLPLRCVGPGISIAS